MARLTIDSLKRQNQKLKEEKKELKEEIKFLKRRISNFEEKEREENYCSNPSWADFI